MKGEFGRLVYHETTEKPYRSLAMRYGVTILGIIVVVFVAFTALVLPVLVITDIIDGRGIINSIRLFFTSLVPIVIIAAGAALTIVHVFMFISSMFRGLCKGLFIYEFGAEIIYTRGHIKLSFSDIRWITHFKDIFIKGAIKPLKIVFEDNHFDMLNSAYVNYKIKDITRENIESITMQLGKTLILEDGILKSSRRTMFAVQNIPLQDVGDIDLVSGRSTHLYIRSKTSRKLYIHFYSDIPDTKILEKLVKIYNNS